MPPDEEPLDDLPLDGRPDGDWEEIDDDDGIRDMPMTDAADWEVFVADEPDPLPEPGDFWAEPDSALE